MEASPPGEAPAECPVLLKKDVKVPLLPPKKPLLCCGDALCNKTQIRFQPQTALTAVLIKQSIVTDFRSSQRRFHPSLPGPNLSNNEVKQQKDACKCRTKPVWLTVCALSCSRANSPEA